MTRWPLTGREADLAAIVAAASSSQTVLLVGASGVGKTRLAEEAVDAIVRRGATPVVIHATEALREVPFGPLLPLIDDLPRHGGNPVDLLLACAAALRRRARGGRLVLLVDDAHLLDASSAALVQQIAAGRGAALLATVRAGEQPPAPLLTLWRAGRVLWYDLGPLAPAEVERLLRTVLGGQVDGAAVRWLTDRSAGNLIVLRELVRSARELGTLVESEGLWRLHGAPAVSGPVRALLADAMATLSPPARRVVELVAYGEPIGLLLLRELVSATALEEAEAVGAIRLSRDRRRVSVLLAHPLFGDVTRDVTPPLRALAVRGELASVIEKAGARRREDLLRLAVWHLDGAVRLDCERLLAAARQAELVCDYPLTIRLADAAVVAEAGPAAELIGARARVWRGDRHVAEDTLARLAADPAIDPATHLQVVIARVVNLYFGLGRSADAMALLDSEMSTVDDLTAAALLTVLRAGILLRQGAAAASLSASDSAAEVLGAPAGEQFRVNALPGQVSALAWCGRTGEAIDVAETGLADAGSDLFSSTYLTELTRIALVGAYGMHGRGADSTALAEEGYDRTLDWGSDELRGGWALSRGVADLAAGRPRSAAKWLREAVGLLTRYTTLLGPTGVVHALGDLAHACALLGDLGTAEDALARAAEVLPKDAFVASYGLGHAWLLAARGDRGAAQRAREVAAEAGALGSFGFEARALSDALRLGDADVAPRLGALAGVVPSPLTTAYAAHARAGRDPVALAGAGAALVACGRVLVAAEAYARAAAYAKPGLGVAYASEARRHLERCEGARTPALRTLDAVPVLSEREQEVARLAAGGLSNREIAAALTLSVRTVETHLQHAYAKLGIGSRGELARAFRTP